METMELKKYQFYYRFTNGGAKRIAKIQTCKNPNLTKVYKALELNFNEGYIHSYGWEVIK